MDTMPERETSSKLPHVAPSTGDAGTANPLLDGNLMGGVVNTARLVEHLKESEINLNMRSLDFGNVAIHTAMNHERLSAQISLERSDLVKVLAGEVPALQSKLSQEHGIQATIEVQQQSSAFSGDSSGSQNDTPRSQPGSKVEIAPEIQEIPVTLPATNAGGRLDVRV
jgi:hypothetical protein